MTTPTKKTGTKTRNRSQPEYGLEIFRQWLETARVILSGPPTYSWQLRPVAKGELVARFVLPLDACPTGNRVRRKQDWWHASLKERIYRLMVMQEIAFRHRHRCPSMLQGRPQVFCVRFSSVPCDLTDLAKEAIDKLCLDKQRRNPKTGAVVHIQRLGYLKDDSPRWVELHQWQEKVSPGKGFVYIEIRSGES